MAQGAVIYTIKAVVFCIEQARQQKKRKILLGTKLTKKAKVTSMDDGFRICLACKIIQGRKPATDVCDAEYTAVCSV